MLYGIFAIVDWNILVLNQDLGGLKGIIAIADGRILIDFADGYFSSISKIV